MKVVKNKITIKELEKMADKKFGDFVKTVVDIKKEIMVVDAGLHADQENKLLETGSRKENLWGINLYPGKKGEDFIEFNSMINLRPNQGNLSRGVENPKIRKRIIEVVSKLVMHS
ncbi:DUF5674 family protein [Patescibacteria group bacterium]